MVTAIPDPDFISFISFSYFNTRSKLIYSITLLLTLNSFYPPKKTQILFSLFCFKFGRFITHFSSRFTFLHFSMVFLNSSVKDFHKCLSTYRSAILFHHFHSIFCSFFSHLLPYIYTLPLFYLKRPFNKYFSSISLPSLFPIPFPSFLFIAHFY